MARMRYANTGARGEGVWKVQEDGGRRPEGGSMCRACEEWEMKFREGRRWDEREGAAGPSKSAAAGGRRGRLGLGAAGLGRLHPVFSGRRGAGATLRCSGARRRSGVAHGAGRLGAALAADIIGLAVQTGGSAVRQATAGGAAGPAVDVRGSGVSACTHTCCGGAVLNHRPGAAAGCRPSPRFCPRT